MRTISAKSTIAIVIVLLIAVINMGCSLRILEQRQKLVTPVKPQESIFIVVGTTDVENPTLVGSIQLPFHVGPNNNVILSGQYAYVMTTQHLHVVNLSDRQHPSLVASMPFPDKVGSARLSGHRLFVAGPREIYIVDVSNPHQPLLQSTTRTAVTLGQIVSFDAHDAYLYVLDSGDYLHIFNATTGEPQFVEAIAVSGSRLLGIRAKEALVEPILSRSTYFSHEIWREILDRQDLLDLSGRYKRLRVSEDYLLFADPVYPARVITIAREDNRGWFGGQFEHYDMEVNYLDYLHVMENERLNRQESTDVYVSSKGILVNNLDGWRQRIDAEVNTLGPITDFQISGDFLYVSNAKGFFSIIYLVKNNRPFQRDSDRFLSAITLGVLHPMSIAVGENYAGVLCDPSGLE
ncbi:hypothetical protein C6503_17370 [Candidatus Poribacteria bacterium]|nr:MAG: hypothetical protein C6503_17370 [Candidatus Poribacteria bacterium]